MATIELIKMGMDFYEGGEDSNMGNFRLRPAYAGACGGSVSDAYLKLPNGHYIAGDFSYWRKNNTNNKEMDQLCWDFTEYDENLQIMGRFKGFDKYDHMKPYIEIIALMLEDVLNEEVKIVK